MQQLESVGKSAVAVATCAVTKMKANCTDAPYVFEKGAGAAPPPATLPARGRTGCSSLSACFLCLLAALLPHCGGFPMQRVSECDERGGWFSLGSSAVVSVWTFTLAHASLHDVMPLVQAQLAISRLPYAEREEALQVRSLLLRLSALDRAKWRDGHRTT